MRWWGPGFEDDGEAALEGAGRFEGPGLAEEEARRGPHPAWRSQRAAFLRSSNDLRPRPRGLPGRGRDERALPLQHVVQDVVQGNFGADHGLTVRPLQRARRAPAADGNGGAGAQAGARSGPSAAERWLQGSPAAFRPDPPQARVTWGPQGVPFLAPFSPARRDGPGFGQRDREPGQAARNGHPRHPPPRPWDSNEARPDRLGEGGGQGFGPTGDRGWRGEGNPQGLGPRHKPVWREAHEWERPPRTRRPPPQQPVPPLGRDAGMDRRPALTRPAVSPVEQAVPPARAPGPPPAAPAREDPPVIELPEDVTVARLAALLSAPPCGPRLSPSPFLHCHLEFAGSWVCACWARAPKVRRQRAAALVDLVLQCLAPPGSPARTLLLPTLGPILAITVCTGSCRFCGTHGSAGLRHTWLGSLLSCLLITECGGGYP